MVLHRVLPITLLFACVAPGEPAEPGEADDSGAPEDSGAPPADADGDGIDAEDDCDDADPSIGEGTPWYPDADGDGYGGDADALALCPGESLPAGTWLSTGGDCDDSTAAAAPGLEEICDDGLDNDCDGTSIGCRHEGSVDRDRADALVLTDPDHVDDPDGGDAVAIPFGAGEALPADIDGDGQLDLVVGAPFTGDGGALAVVRGPLSGTSYLSEASAAVNGDDADGWFGWELAAGDLDGDGYPEVIGGAPISGQILAFSGPVLGDLDAADASAVWTGEALDRLSMAWSEDLTGDGERDLLVGAPTTGDGSGGLAGAAWVISGPPSGGALEDEPLALWGQGDDRAGISVSPAGDVDGDGVADALIGAWTAASGEGYGAAYLARGPLTDAMALEDADRRWSNGPPGNTGEVVANVGDLDGDGLPDVGLGLPSFSYSSSPLEKQGAVFVLSGVTPSTSRVQDSSFFTIYGTQGWDSAVGSSVSGGDLDGDGQGDLLLVAYLGYAQVRYGPVEGAVLDLLFTDLDQAVTVDSTVQSAFLADMDGDGTTDLYLSESTRWFASRTTHVGWLLSGTAW